MWSSWTNIHQAKIWLVRMWARNLAQWSKKLARKPDFGPETQPASLCGTGLTTKKSDSKARTYAWMLDLLLAHFKLPQDTKYNSLIWWSIRLNKNCTSKLNSDFMKKTKAASPRTNTCATCNLLYLVLQLLDTSTSTSTNIFFLLSWSFFIYVV